MKEIGEKLKETRENMGVSIEEASEDLKIVPSQIEEVEDGNMKAFKDIFSLKLFIKDYSKYLGLDYDEMVDEFNEYLFDYTSKISLEDIKKATEDEKKDKTKSPKIVSPYTIEKKKTFNFKPILIGLLVLCIIGGASYIIYDKVINNDKPKTDNIIR
ncbi:MAG TPA: helix-turn-helix domain-containing protein [Bacilli bacterium]|nr:helix-turn-helix domain-containing protein [Bacilli bacterium]